MIEAALDGELTDHLGDEKHDPAGKDGGNSRNGVRSKTVLTDVGPVEITVPRDRDGSFEPQIVRKRQRRLTGVEDMVLSLSAKRLTTGEISAHLAEVYGRRVAADDLHDRIYLAVMALDPTGSGRRRWITRWKPALNAFDLAFEGRLTTGPNQPPQDRVTPFSTQSSVCGSKAPR